MQYFSPEKKRDVKTCLKCLSVFMYLCLSVFRLYVPVLILLLNQFNNFPQKIEIISEINI